MNKICTIICGAPCNCFPADKVEGYVIAADRGLDYAIGNNISVDMAVGDFDSAHSTVPEGIECIKVSPIKDDTDAMLAADIAIEKGFTELRFLCAIGGRLDHTIANIQMLLNLKQRGVSAEMYGDDCKCFVLENEQRVIPKNCGYLSVFALSESTDISEQGVKYPLDMHTIYCNFPLGVSNEITDENAIITVHQGTALVILQEERN